MDGQLPSPSPSSRGGSRHRGRPNNHPAALSKRRVGVEGRLPTWRAALFPPEVAEARYLSSSPPPLDSSQGGSRGRKRPPLQPSTLSPLCSSQAGSRDRREGEREEWWQDLPEEWSVKGWMISITLLAVEAEGERVGDLAVLPRPLAF